MRPAFGGAAGNNLTPDAVWAAVLTSNDGATNVPVTFSAHSWLYSQKGIRLSGVTPLAAVELDRAGQPAAIWGHHSPRTEKQGNSYNGSSDRIPRRPWGRALTATMVVTLAATLLANTASAQQQQQPEAAPKAAPKTQPAQPAQPLQPAQPQQQAADQPQLMYSPNRNLRRGTGYGQQASLRHHERWPSRKRHAGRDCSAVRAGRRAEGAARHGSARHAARARHAHAHRSGPADAAALQDLLSGRLHGRLSSHRRHDRAR